MPAKNAARWAAAGRAQGLEHGLMVDPHLLIGPGNPGSGDAIGVAVAEARNLPESRSRSVGCGDQHWRDAVGACRSGEGRGFDQWHVGDEQAVDAGLGGGGIKGVPAAGDDDIGVGEDSDRNVGVARAESPEQVETVAGAHPGGQGADRGGLMTGPIGDGSRKGTDFQHVGAI